MPLTYDDKLDALLRALYNGVLPGIAVLVPLAAATGIGLLVLLATRSASVDGGSRLGLPFATIIGFGTLAYVADLVYMLQVVPAAYFAGFGMIAGIVALLMNGRRMELWPASDPPAPECGPTGRAERILTVVAWSVVLLGLLKYYMNTVVPVNDHDSITHYSFLSRLIATGVPLDDVVLLRKMPIADTNRLVPHLYAFGRMMQGEGSMHVMNFVFFCTTLLLVHNFCVRRLAILPWWSPLPSLLMLNVFENLAAGYSAKVDYGVAMFEVALVFAVVARRSLPRWVLPMLAGIAIAARINSLRMVVAIGVILLIDLLMEHRAGGKTWPASIRGAGAEIAWLGLAALAVGSPPYLMNWAIYGNPLFPFLNGILGSYPHWYDYVLFRHQRYDAGGILGPLRVYVQVCLTRLWQFLPEGDFGGRYGLGPIFLLAPIAVERKRWALVLYGVFAAGFFSWWGTSNTHRTLLGIAFISVPLIAGLIVRIRRAPMVYYAVHGVLMLMVGLTLYGRPDIDYFPYFTGKATAGDFYERNVRLPHRPMLTPSLGEVASINRIAGNEPVMAVNVVLHAHPSLRRIFFVALPEADMLTRLHDTGLDHADRIAILRSSQPAYLRARYRDFARQFFPADTAAPLPVLKTRSDKWRFASMYYDTQYMIHDEIYRRPALITNLMRVQGVRFLVAPQRTPGSDFSAVAELRRVWESDAVIVYELAGIAVDA